MLRNRLAASHCLLAMVLTGFGFTGAASAGTILFDNLSAANGGFAEVNNGGKQAASFSTDASGGLLSAVFLEFQGTATAGSFTISLYSSTTDPLPAPNASLEVFSSYPDPIVPGGSFAPFHTSGLSFALAPSTRYWIVVAGTSATDDVLWSSVGGSFGTGVSGEFFGFDDSVWSTAANGLGAISQRAMQVNVLPATATTPEPATALFMFAGLVALVGFSTARRARRGALGSLAAGIVFIGLSFAPPASATSAVLFNNTNLINGGDATINTFGTAASFSTDNNFYLLADIILELEAVQGASGSFTVSIYSSSTDPSPVPVASLEVLGTSQDNVLQSGSYAPVQFNGNSFALTPNTRYWVVLFGTTGTDALWEAPDGAFGPGVAGEFFSHNTGPSAWVTFPNSTTNGSQLEMEVDGFSSAVSTPEPATGFCMLAGLGGLAAALARRRR